MSFKKLLKKAISVSLNFFAKFYNKSTYIKFVIITRSRTGSNLLISLLNSNSKIQAYGEKFQILGGHSCIEIYNQIFPKKSNKIIGFKIFYYHPVDSDDKSIWDILKNNHDFKIIHLQRKNLLRVHISRLIAGKTNVWSLNQNEIDIVDKMVYIDFDFLFRDFERTNLQVLKINEEFRNHEKIDVFYEDLINNKDLQMATIFDFLNVKNTQTDSKLKRQNPEPLEDLIINYKELIEKLKNTEFSWMLYQ